MGYRIFLAGASGAIGRRLTPLLHSAGHYVCGSTRSEANADALRSLGADPVVVDVFDASALSRAVASARPDVVIHQLTDLPKDLNPREMGAAIVRTARVRSEGTRNLVRAAIAAGARRLVAQSIAWAEPHAETDPLDAGAEGDSGINLQGVIALEDLTLKSPPLEGVVLRYGQLYGPGTPSDRPSNSAPVHVDAAAYAALLAIDHGDPGIYNIAQSNRHVATEKKGTRGPGLDSRFSSSGLKISHGGSAGQAVAMPRHPRRCGASLAKARPEVIGAQSERR
jgi:nucleoside-diphosphate-sugar epimerase